VDRLHRRAIVHRRDLQEHALELSQKLGQPAISRPRETALVETHAPEKIVGPRLLDRHVIGPVATAATHGSLHQVDEEGAAVLERTRRGLARDALLQEPGLVRPFVGDAVRRGEGRGGRGLPRPQADEQDERRRGRHESSPQERPSAGRPRREGRDAHLP
jgi:hypothetical protein